MSKFSLILVTTALIITAAISAVADKPGESSLNPDAYGISDVSISGEPAAIAGKWKLEADAQGQPVDLILVLTQEAADFSGTVSTPYGDGEVKDGKLSDSDFKARIDIEIQGQQMELSFTGKVDGENMSGSIEGDDIPVVTFTGSKEKPEDDTLKF